MSSRLFDRNFALLFQGSMVSLFGGVIADVALLWWLVDVAHAPGLIALMNVLSFVAVALVTPFAGAITDRVSRKLVLVASDLLTGLVYGGLGLAVVASDFSAHTIAVLVVIAVLASEIGQVFYAPASQVAIVDLISRGNIQAANAVMSMGSRIATITAQSLAGVLYRILGMPVLMMVNGASYLISGLCSLFLRFPTLGVGVDDAPGSQQSLWADVKEGFVYVSKQPGFARLVILYSTFMFFTASHSMLLLPLFVQSALRESPAWFGYIMAAYAIGGVLGAMFGGVVRVHSGRARATITSLLFFAISGSLATFALLDQPILAVAANAVIGFGFGVLSLFIRTTYQLRSDPKKLGRVVALQMQAVTASSALGLTLTGVILQVNPDHLRSTYLLCAIGAGLPGLVPLFDKTLWQLFDWNKSSSKPIG